MPLPRFGQPESISGLVLSWSGMPTIAERNSHNVCVIHRENEIFNRDCVLSVKLIYDEKLGGTILLSWDEMAQWLEREFTGRKARGSSPTSAARLLLPRLGKPGIIPALVLPSSGLAVRHRKGATAERYFLRPRVI
ncbi:hypothetical protein CSKR_102687 [Clonorchis sinensis]|uniref:Uncharacterized protein n=1 Tax=Clonorchis sinensis TaxID=79923 RepID=A0A3R7ESS3_CLOSI|nr:hypothetical protein CSKR_102687 [Clonorchis sinensis]